MALHMRYQTTPGGGFTTVDLAAAGVSDIKLRISYSHPSTLTWSMHAPQHTFPMGIRHFVQFWDDAGDNPFTGGTQSSAAPLFEGFIEDVKPGDESNLVNYIAMDPTRRASVDMPLANIGYLAGSPPVPFPGSVPRLVFNVAIDNDDDYAVSILQWATMGQIMAYMLDAHGYPLAWLNAGPSVGNAYVPSDLASLTFIPQEKQVFASESLRPALERLLHQWEPSWRLLWYPGLRKWRFGDLTQCPEVTLTLNDFTGDWKVIALHLDRSLDQRATAVKYYGPPKLVEVNALWSDGSLTEVVSGQFLQNNLATCCTVPLLNRWQITDPFLRVVARKLQLPIPAQYTDFSYRHNIYPTFFVHYPNNTRAGKAGWRAIDGWNLDARNGIISFGDQGVYRYNANPNGGEPNYEVPDDVKFTYATFGDPITARWPLTGYQGTAYDIANVQTELTLYDEMLAVAYEANQPVTTPMRLQQFRTLARRKHTQTKDIVYAGSCVLLGCQYAFAALNARINFAAIDEDGDPLTTGWEAIKACLTDVEFDFDANGKTTLQLSSNQMELMGIDVENQKERLKIVKLDRVDWSHVTFGTTIRARTISDKAGGFSNLTSVHEFKAHVDAGHKYVNPLTGEDG